MIRPGGGGGGPVYRRRQYPELFPTFFLKIKSRLLLPCPTANLGSTGHYTAGATQCHSATVTGVTVGV